MEPQVAQRHERLDRLEGDPQPGGVAERAVGVGEPVEQVGVLALGPGRDDLAGAGEDVHLEDRLVGQAAAERRRLDPEPGDRAPERDGLELRAPPAAPARGAGSPRRGARRCTCPARRPCAPRRRPRSRSPRPDTSRPGASVRGPGTEQVGGLLGQPHRGVGGNRSVARGKPAHREVMARTWAAVRTLPNCPGPALTNSVTVPTLCRRRRQASPGLPGFAVPSCSSRRGLREHYLHHLDLVADPQRARVAAPRHTPRGSCGPCR